jgi:hypothetical protein
LEKFVKIFEVLGGDGEMSIFDELKKIDQPLHVETIDLYEDKKNRRKPSFDDKDLRMDYSSETLQQGKVIVPIFTDTTIYPLGFKSKYLFYQFDPHGPGLYELIQLVGKRELGKDERHLRPVDVQQSNPIYLGFDSEKKHYRTLSKKDFLDRKEENEKIKENPEIIDAIYDYFEFFKRAETSHIDPYNIPFEILQKYLFLRKIWGEIPALYYDQAIREIEGAKRFVSGKLENGSIDDKTDCITRIYKLMTTAGYSLVGDLLIPNIARMHQLSQPAQQDEFRSQEIINQSERWIHTYLQFSSKPFIELADPALQNYLEEKMR